MDHLEVHGNDTAREYIDIPLSVQVIHLVLGMAILTVNLIVMVAYAQDKEIRRVPPNVYILNLSISDFIIGLHLLVRFFWAVRSGARVPLQKSLPCIILGAVHYASLITSVLIVIEISWDRLKMVSNPFKYRQRTVRLAVIISTCSWCVPVIYISFLIFVAPLVADFLLTESEGAICLETELPRLYVFVSLWLEFVIPFIILLVLNSLVILKLRKATLERFQRQKSEYKGTGHEVSLSETSSPNIYHDPMNTASDGKESTQQLNTTGLNTHVQADRDRWQGNGVSSEQSPTDARIKEATKREFMKLYRTATLLRVFVGVYFFCWMPFYVVLVINQFTALPDWVTILASVNISFNSFINPFLYAYMSKKFRRRFLLMLKCRRR